MYPESTGFIELHDEALTTTIISNGVIVLKGRVRGDAYRKNKVVGIGRKPLVY